MSSRSSLGSWQRVLDVRSRSREALGRDPNQIDLFDGAPVKRNPSYLPLSQPPEEPRPSKAIMVLTLSEAATRLAIGRGELEAMIAAGKIEALKTGFTRMIPTREIGWFRALRP